MRENEKRMFSLSPLSQSTAGLYIKGVVRVTGNERKKFARESAVAKVHFSCRSSSCLLLYSLRVQKSGAGLMIKMAEQPRKALFIVKKKEVEQPFFSFLFLFY